MEIIQAIRKEIISRINKRHLSKQAQNELVSILSFLSTLESEKPVPKDLEEAAEISFDEAYALTGDYTNFLAKGLKENHSRPIGPRWFCKYAKNRFVAGAKWQKEQMTKEAVEGEVCGRVYDHINVRFADGVCKFLEPKNISHIPADVSKYKVGDKVRIIIVKED